MPQTQVGFGHLLQRSRDVIVSRFTAEIQRQGLLSPETPQPLLVDHIPVFIDRLADQLESSSISGTLEATAQGKRRGGPSQEAATRATAAKHAAERWLLGYDLQGLIREYGILRESILHTASQAGVQLSNDEFDVLSHCLTSGISEAAAHYVEHRDGELLVQQGNLEFLADAGQLLSTSLDFRSTLTRLLGLLVPRLADWCVIHLEGETPDEMPIAHVDASKIEVLREIYRRFPLPADSPYGFPYVLRTGQPQLVSRVDPAALEASARSAEHLELLRQIAACSWLMVPLRVQGELFGALTLAYSVSGRHYESSDLVLATDLSRRAAIAIDNARLYALSQRERSRVEAATRAKDEFVAMVSHELRTPLNAILGWVRLMRGSSMDESKRAHAFEVIERNAEAQSQLVSDLLDISRIMTGKIRLNPAQMDLANLVDMTIEGVRPAAQAKRIQIDAELERNTVLRADPDRLQQVIWNLLVNAVKFTPKGGRVRVSVRRKDSDLEIEVHDNGEGIPGSFLPHLFESFRQSDSGAARPHGGLGIGLSISRHLVELHGGSIEASSGGPGQGSTFRVRLPISPVVSTTLGVTRVPATTPAEPSQQPALEGDGIQVLVVEDEPDARDLVAYVFESCGMKVRLAASAAEAMRALESFSPAVIVSDIGMPEEDGYALIRKIRTHSDERKRNIPAIALTAFVRNEDRTRALVEGFNLHLAKPVEPAALVRAVAELVGRVGKEPLSAAPAANR
jgi:signal transduction histidine kinase/CheY-like chemotaxis protein